MEADGRGQLSERLKDLQNGARRYHFYRVMHALEGAGLSGPGQVQISASHDRTFPGSDIESVLFRRDSSVDEDSPGSIRGAEVTVRFFGFAGVHGSLPNYFEHVLQLERHGDSDADKMLGRNLRILLQIIESRYYHFLYEIFNRNNPYFASGRNLAVTLQNPVLSLSGLGFLARGTRQNVLQALPYLLQTWRSSWGLRRLLTVYLRVPVDVEEHVPFDVPLAPSERWRLGHAKGFRLGRNTRALPYRHTRNNALRVVLGPLTLAQYIALLPGSEGHRLLTYLLHYYLSVDLEYFITYALESEAIPKLSLKLGSRRAILGAMTVMRPRRRRTELRIQRRGVTAASNPSRLQEIVASFEEVTRAAEEIA